MRLPSRRWLLLLLLIPLVLGFVRLRLDTEVLDLLPSDLPAVRGLKLHQQNFANAGELILTVKAADAETAEACARSLAANLRTNEAVHAEVTWTPPWIEHPGQAAELIAYLWLNQPPAVVEQLAARLAPEQLAPTLAAVRERLASSLSPEELSRLSYDPFDLARLPGGAERHEQGWQGGEELFASEDGRFRLVRVRARTALLQYQACVHWLETVKAAVETWRTREPAGANVHVQYTGRPAFVAEIAGGLEKDLALPSLGTLAVIAILFYLVHRRWLPLLWLFALLISILLATLALGGLFFGSLNVVSVGFAAILLGLAEDFGIVLYQEARCHPHRAFEEIRREVMPGIVWSALACSGAFLLLNLSGLPGLGQLGSLVALGIGLAAIVMLTAYLPPLLRPTLRQADPHNLKPGGREAAARRVFATPVGWTLTGLMLLLVLIVGWRQPPAFDRSPDALKPRKSPASAAVLEIRQRLGRLPEPWWIVVEGRDSGEVRQRLVEVGHVLEQAVADRTIAAGVVPTALWPHPDYQASNRARLRDMAGRPDLFRQAAQAQGFSSHSLVFTELILETWREATATTNLFWPGNASSRWVLEQCVARSPDSLFALGLVYPHTNPAGGGFADFADLGSRLPPGGVWLSGWEMLGPSMVALVLRELPGVLVPILALVLGILWLAFRTAKDVLLSLATLAFGLAGLVTVMSLAGWSWNMMNLTALPLLVGMGVDFSIHIQLALIRHRGDAQAVYHSVGRALLLAGATTIAGFVSLGWSSNAGLASLGRVCAAGIATTLLTSVYLLPTWWRTFTRRVEAAPVSEHAAAPTPRKPSRLYRAAIWRLGLAVVRILPTHLCVTLARALGLGYWAIGSARRKIVVDNLLPVVGGDPAVAGRAARSLFVNFGCKIADLWRYESGQSIDPWLAELKGTEAFAAAVAKRRGLLLVTPHLGNWEFGAPLMAQRGVPVLAITQAEPDRALTSLRIASRARWGIETLVIQEDPFAFVEIIRRLEAGATVALLVDRPHPATSVTVQLFGCPIAASVAPAELARATGCIVLPVCVFRDRRGYCAHVLPEINYDRAGLREVAARVRLTQEILRAFEPVIRQHPDQWYHFVPIWRPSEGPAR